MSSTHDAVIQVATGAASALNLTGQQRLHRWLRGVGGGHDRDGPHGAAGVGARHARVLFKHVYTHLLRVSAAPPPGMKMCGLRVCKPAVRTEQRPTTMMGPSTKMQASAKAMGMQQPKKQQGCVLATRSRPTLTTLPASLGSAV